jgi:hypothetical protein
MDEIPERIELSGSIEKVEVCLAIASKTMEMMII